MLSRAANSIYWMSRYIERVENYARFISVNVNLSYDITGLVNEHWLALLEATNDKEQFETLYGNVSEDSNKIIDFMTFDEYNPNSIYYALSCARENARTIRETLPKEVWEHLNGFYLNFKEQATSQNRNIENITAFFEKVKEECQLFTGIIDATLNRNEAFHFGALGRFLERADKTSRILDIAYFNFSSADTKKVITPTDLLKWSAVLKSASALNMYRQGYKSLKQINIIEFLIKDRLFPRSICFSVKKAENSLYRISGRRIQDGYSNSAEKAISQLVHELDFTESADILKNGLHHYLNGFQIQNNSIDQEIFKVYFDIETK